MEKIVRSERPKLSNHTEYKSELEMIKGELLKMTEYRCSYTGMKLTYETAVIDQFKPSNQSIEKDNWNNLFIVQKVTNQIKANHFNALLLKPDADDYDFDKYFEINFENSKILPRANLSESDKNRAKITIDIFGLNHQTIVKNREDIFNDFFSSVLWYSTNSIGSDFQEIVKDLKKVHTELDINNYSYRFFLKNFLQSHRVNKNKYINNIIIEKYFCVENFEIGNIQSKKEIYLLGENGDGKTIVLQAILLAAKSLFANFLYKHLDEKYINDFSINVQDKERNNYNFNNNITSVHTNIYAYGVGRLHNHKEPDEVGYLSLFNYNTELTNPIEWFKEAERLELKGIGKIRLDTIINLFENLLENKVQIIGTNRGDFIFKEKDSELKFNQLSDGYRSVLIWLSDLLSRLTKNNPDIEKLEDYKAIVLVDEIGCFLHPKWEYTIVRKLRNMFPKIQWIFTTHSPIVTLGASKDAVFYKLYKEEGITKVSEPFNMETYANRMLSSFITSPLFNLPTARPAAFEGNGEDLETGDYIYTLIHQEIRKRLKNKPLQDNEIKDMISDLIDEFEKEGKI